MSDKITIEKCPCGQRGCNDYHLVGIGKFVQGSGFTIDEAHEIADALNAARQKAPDKPGDGLTVLP